MMEQKNHAKMAFISCVNDEKEYAQCCCYLEHLNIPNAFEIETIAVREAASMASGYNIGMQYTNAKYKVYLHQDVFITNKNFIFDLLQIFSQDDKIGMAGMIGSKKLEKNAVAVTGWDLGAVASNGTPSILTFPQEECRYTQAQAADGFLLATQADLPWREDIFDGWDFYDISQCMEFQKAGYQIVIPSQKEPWCYHDNTYSKMTEYESYRERFCQEYAAWGSFEFRKRSDYLLNFERAKETVRREVELLISNRAVTELRKLFNTSENRGFLYLREYECIVFIDWLEEQRQIQNRFWLEGMTAEQLVTKLRSLKYALKRIEYGVAGYQAENEDIHENYSQYAKAVVCDYYHIDVKESGMAREG